MKMLNKMVIVGFSVVCFQSAFATEIVAAIDSKCTEDCIALDTMGKGMPMALDIGHKQAQELRPGDVFVGEQGKKFMITDVASGGKDFTVIKGTDSYTRATTPSPSTPSPLLKTEGPR